MMVAEEISAAEEVLVVAELAGVHAESRGIVADRFEAGQAGAAAMVGHHLARIARDAAARRAMPVVAGGTGAAISIRFAHFANDAAGNRAVTIQAFKIAAAAAGFAGLALVRAAFGAV